MSQITTKNITNHAVTNAKLAQMPANTVKGNNTGSTADAMDLTIAQAQVLLNIPTVTNPLAVGSGGTGQNSYADGQILIGNSSGGSLVKTTLTAGAGVTVTNGNGSITLASTGITALTGDATATGPGSAALTLATVNANVGTFTNATITVNAKGLITAASSGSAGTVAYNVTAQSTTYSAVINDYVVASGASFTITLPTAVGQSGKSIVIQHNGTSLSQLYTLNTTSSQTIGGIASGSYILYTNGETLNLISDGSNWQILEHRVSSGWTTYTPTFTGYGTPASVGFTYRRMGDTLEVSGYYTTGTNTGVTVSITLPTGINIDTAKFTKGATTANPGQTVGNWVINTAQSSGHVVINTGTSTSLIYLGGLSGGANMETPQVGTIWGNAAQMSIWFRVPISGWQP